MTARTVEQQVLTNLGYQGAAKAPDWTNGRPIEEVAFAYAPQGSNLVLFTHADTDLEQLHRRVWSQGEASLLVVSEPTRVRVISGRQIPPDRRQPLRCLAELPVGEWAGLQRFARWEVDQSPHQWDAGASGLEYLAKQTAAAFAGLLGGVGATPALPPRTAQALLGRAVFVRYLTDRGSLDARITRALSDGRFDRFEDSLDDVTEVRFFLDRLNEQFNGSVFPLAEDDWACVTTDHLDALRQIVDREGDQFLLWKLDFSHLPVGFFSRLFELFLTPEEKKDAGAFYTPPGVVDFVLGETMPVARCNPEWRVLDPACGSGVFLVRAFHRLVLAWRRIHGTEPAATDLVAILDRLRGVDVDGRAVRVTALSLYLALLEHLPDSILREPGFRLPPLIYPGSQILRAADFFDPDLDTDLRAGSFDRVLGNPPWRRGRGSAPSRGNWEAWVRRRRLPTTQGHLAPAFLWRAAELVKPGGEVAMLAPSDVVLAGQSTAQPFRDRFYVNHTVRVVADLTLLRRDLFGVAASPTAALFFTAQAPRGDEWVTTAVPKYSTERRVGLIPLITPADVDSLPLAEILADNHRFLTARYGTSADAALIRRLGRLRPLGEVCSHRGFQVGSGLKCHEDIYSETVHQSVSPVEEVDPPARTGIATVDLQPYRIARLDGEQLRRNKWTPESLRHVRHDGPTVLLHQQAKRWPHCAGMTEKRLAAAYLPSGRVYRNAITGVNGTARDRTALSWLVAFYNSSLASYVAFHTAARWTGARGALNKEDVIALPFFFPDPADPRLAAVAGLVDDAGVAMGRGAEGLATIQARLDELVMDLYGLSDRERALVGDTLQYAIPHFHWVDAGAKEQRRPDAESPATFPMLEAYANRFAATVAPLVQAARGPLFFHVRPPEASESLAVVAFSHRRATLGRVSELALSDLARRCPADECSIYLRRFVDAYVDDVLYCVRPNMQRFWTRSRAVADAQSAIAEWLNPEGRP